MLETTLESHYIFALNEFNFKNLAQNKLLNSFCSYSAGKKKLGFV